jgi:hypothetical protein
MNLVMSLYLINKWRTEGTNKIKNSQGVWPCGNFLRLKKREVKHSLFFLAPHTHGAHDVSSSVALRVHLLPTFLTGI